MSLLRKQLSCGCAPIWREYCAVGGNLKASVEHTQMLAMAGHIPWDMHGTAHRRFEEHLGADGPGLDRRPEDVQITPPACPWTVLEYFAATDRYLVGNSEGNVLLVSGQLRAETENSGNIWAIEGPVRVPAKVQFVTLPDGYRYTPIEVTDCTPLEWETVVPRKCTVSTGCVTRRIIRLGWGARCRKWCVWEDR